ncbi:MAG: exodeoxyribonuclease VII small subunit [candidate division Zixibacteria bacterium RBG_16_48_11]|nr:MAG: exodeoxyribonuclease VII small subunit [candidate division Zixibacteria bacterium RBG_16_48_11]
MPAKKLTFEKAVSRLEEIAEKLESGELPLEESLKIFKEGIELSRWCSQVLNQTESDIKKLVKLEGKKFKLEALDLEAEDEA